MTTTLTHTFNRDDISRVYASFAADYKIVAEWTGLHSAARIDRNIGAIKALAGEQYLRVVHVLLRTRGGQIRQAAVYSVSTNVSGWSSDRPGGLYWQIEVGDYLQLIVSYNANWSALSQIGRDVFRALHMPGWGPVNFDGNYGSLSSSTDRRYASRAYGMERTCYSA